MKLIADANILFSLVKSTSVTNEIVSDFDLKLYSVDFVLDELEKHKSILLKKSGLKTFSQVVTLLNKYVIFIKVADLKSELKQMQHIVSDEKDIIYFALARKLDLVIWSNDKHFKEQIKFDVVTTKELIHLLF